MLIQAARAVNRGYYRRAVIDYATAAEACLSRMVQNSPDAKKPGDRSNLHGWSNWLASHESDRYTKDPDFDEFVDLRNAAAHRGIEPSSDQIRTAAKCAHRIVKAHGVPQNTPEPLAN